MAITIYPETKALIFDLDGTLINSMPAHKLAWQEICSRKGFDFTDEIFYRYAGVPSERILQLLNEQYGTSFDPESDSHLKEEAYKKRVDMVKPIPEIVAIADKYHKLWPMSVGTGGPGKASREILSITGLDQYFDILVSKDDVVNGKPAPDTFLKCAELMQVDPAHCQVFEDGDPGMEAAEKAGMMATDIRPWVGSPAV